MKQLVSVIVPAYNCANTLKRCIDSILQQTYKEYEIIIVDDGSTDDTSSLCDTYISKNKNIKVIHKKNNGVSSARNVGIDNAKGEYLYFIDSDDSMEPEALNYMVQNIKGNDIIISNHNCVNKLNAVKHELKEYSKFEEFICYNMIWAPWGKLVKKACITEKFDETKHVGEDLLFWISNSKNINSFEYIDKCLYNYYINKESVMHSENFNLKKHLTTLNVFIEIMDLVDKDLQDFFMMKYVYFYNRIRIRTNSQNIAKDYSKYNDKYYKCIMKNMSMKCRIKYYIINRIPRIYFLIRGEEDD